MNKFANKHYRTTNDDNCINSLINQMKATCNVIRKGQKGNSLTCSTFLILVPFVELLMRLDGPKTCWYLKWTVYTK